MAYSTIYSIFTNRFYFKGFQCYRPTVGNNRQEVSLARKFNKPVFGKNNNSVAFPDNYKTDSEIYLSAYDTKNSIERTGYYQVSNREEYESVILNVKELMVKVPVPVKPGFFQDVIRQSILDQTHTISSVGKTVCVQGKFKFNEGFLELDFEE